MTTELRDHLVSETHEQDHCTIGHSGPDEGARSATTFVPVSIHEDCEQRSQADNAVQIRQGNGYVNITLALLSTLLTLVALVPIAYCINRNMPPRVATVDLQVLIEEEQTRALAMMHKSGEVTDEQRVLARKLAIDFAKTLSHTVDVMAQECHCVIINKAALLGGAAIDYTDQVRDQMRARMQ